MLDTYYGDRAKELFEIIMKERINAIDYLRLHRIAEDTFKERRRVRYFVHMREIAFFLYNKYLKRMVRQYHPVMSRKVPKSEKGVSIAFLGQDGAGKTTVTKQLIKWWSWKMDVRYVYLGSGENYFSLKKKLTQKLMKMGRLRHLGSVIALIDTYDLTKKAYRNICQAEKYVSKGGMVIYDRFPQMECAGICDGPKIRKKVEANFGKGLMTMLFVPLAMAEERYIKKIIAHHPNIVFKLILPPEESIRRKPRERIEVVRQKHEIVKSLSFPQSDVYIINATMPYDEEIIMIKNIIWQHIQK